MDIRKAFLSNGRRGEEYARAAPEDRCRGGIAITETANGGLGGGRENYNLCREMCASCPWR